MFFADLHIHSGYSRGTSKELSIDKLEEYARLKGIDVLGTGDFTHPLWMKEIKEKLREENGILKTKNGFNFVLSTEISLIYTKGTGRRIHLVILSPDFNTAFRIIEYLKTKGRLDYDGRPIFNIPSPEFVRRLKEISSEIEIIPAHIWTPWFSLFGSQSGFDSVKECFEDQIKHIYAMETGLSSDPEMNRKLSQLDEFSMVSFSDSHSFWPWRLGREATIFEGEINYKNIIERIRNGNIYGTIEVDPSYGKYYYDGHRNCGVCFTPKQTMKNNGICPECGKGLTLGVENRVENLSDQESSKQNDFKILPLAELISKYYNIGINTKKMWNLYNRLTEGSNELDVLLNKGFEELNKVDEKLAKIIISNREGRLNINPGYDGVYGEVVFEKQTKLV